jgi:serine/threonine-protein kinase
MWDEMDAVAQKALARNPEDRFQTAERFMGALNAAMEARTSDNLLPVDLTKLSRTAVTEAAVGAAPTRLGVTMADQLSVGAIDGLSRTLARWLGPIARFVINQALHETTDADTLIASLSRQIKTGAEITLFRQAAEKLLREDFCIASTLAREMISDAEITAAVDALICEIGPIAKRLVSMEAQTAVGRDDFYRRLADQIPDKRAKARFLALREQPTRNRTH